LFIFIVWIVIAVWVYRDAEERRMSGMLWAILIILFGVIPLIIYFLVRKDKTPKVQYPYGYTYPPPSGGAPYPSPHLQPMPGYTPPRPNFCRACGKRLSPNTVECPACGERI
jgi:hypothetical protein